MSITIERTVSRDAMTTTESLSGYTFTGEAGAHQFVISATRGGEPEALTGTVTANFLRSDNQNVAMGAGDCALTDGKAVVELPQACYNVPGRFLLTIYLTNSGVTEAIYSAAGNVQRAKSETYVDTGFMPNFENLTEVAEEFPTVKAAAEAATAAVTSLSTRVTTAEGNITTLGTSVSGLGTRMTAAESGITGLDGRLDTVEDTLVAQELDPEVTWTQQSIGAGGVVADSNTRCLSSIIVPEAGDVVTATGGVKFRLAWFKDGSYVTAGNWVTEQTVTSANLNNFDSFRINCQSAVNSNEYITPEKCKNCISYSGSKLEKAQAAAKDQLGALETRVSATETVNVAITATAPTITAVENRRYLCGTLTSLSFTPCASGLCEVIFASGSTPTTLTGLTGVKMPDWWTGVAANRVYDIMVLNGTLGVVMSWAT